MLDAIKGDKDLKASALKFVENYNSDEDEKNYDIVHVKEKPKWDCETIISTYSNLYNRPKVWLASLGPKIDFLQGRRIKSLNKIVWVNRERYKNQNV